MVTALILAMTESERPFVRTAVESVLNQSVPVRVIVYVDEQGTVGQEIVDLPGLIRRVPLAPVGQMRNLAMSEVETEWFAWLDGDDLWHSRKIERQLAYAGDHDIVACNHLMITESGVPFAFGLSKRMPMTSGWLVRTSCRYIPFENKSVAKDSAWMRSARRQFRILRMPQTLIQYRVRSNSLSSSTCWKARKERVRQIASHNPVNRFLFLTLTYIASRSNQSYRYEK